jgi:hypothetical protein
VRIIHVAVWALESLGPLTIIGAQVLYLSKPLLQPIVIGDYIMPLARLLEDHDECHGFIEYLQNKRPL